MDDLLYLKEALIFLIAAICIVPLFQRLRSSPILGYLAAGLIIGPNGFALIANNQNVHSLAELGIIFLLFAIGLELSLSKLRALSRYIFGLGGLQVLLSGTSMTLIAYFLGTTLSAAIIIGFGLGLSSTAFCSKLLSEKKATNTRFGRLSIAILVMQDLAVVPLLTLVPLLNQNQNDIIHALGLALLKAVVAISLIILLGRFILRPIYCFIANYKNPELFMGTTLLIILGTAWTTSQAGLSVELGAFLAGLLLAESEYRHQIESDIRPFRGILIGLFFITIGMTLNLQFAMQYLWQALLILIALLLIKSLILFFLCRSFRLSIDLSAKISSLLSQSGEFAFLLFASAMTLNILNPILGQFLLLVVTLSMVATPLMANLGERIANYYENKQHEKDSPAIQTEAAELSDHVIIAGFGRVGQIISTLLDEYGITYIALDLNAKNIRQCREKKKNVFYGDANQLELLEALNIEHAQAIVVTLDEARTAEHIIMSLRHQFPNLLIYARAHDQAHAEKLQQCGANDIVLETVEASLQLGGMLLNNAGLNQEIIQESLEKLRKNDVNLTH